MTVSFIPLHLYHTEASSPLQDAYPLLILQWQKWQPTETPQGLVTLEILPPAYIEPSSGPRKGPSLQLVQCLPWQSCLMAHNLTADDHVKLLGRSYPLPETGQNPTANTWKRSVEQKSIHGLQSQEG